MTDDDIFNVVLLKTKTHGQHVALCSMASRCSQMATAALHFKDDHPDLKLINHLNVGCIMDCLKMLIETPLCFPRYLFQTLQNTTIKLAVTPQPRPGESVTLTLGSQLAVKVEGIVQGSSQHRLTRQVRAVQVTVTSQFNANPVAPDGKVVDSGMCLSKTVEPHNDYFSSQFLLSFTCAGAHQVSVDTAMMDFSGALWNAGPKAQFSVKTFEEGGTSKSSASSSSSRTSSVANSSRN